VRKDYAPLTYCVIVSGFAGKDLLSEARVDMVLECIEESVTGSLPSWKATDPIEKVRWCD